MPDAREEVLREFGWYEARPPYLAVDAMADEIVRLRKQLDLAASHVNELTDNDACQKDHHGYCQTHFLTDPCVVDEARKWLATYLESVER